MQIKDELLKRKKKLLFEMLFNREIAFFWNFIEKNSIRSEISSLMKIRIVSHEIWQVFEFQVLKALIKTVAKMIKNRIKNDVLKFCYKFYRNSWFLVKKKKKKISSDQCCFEDESSHHSKCELAFCDWRISEKFADCAIVSLVNLFFEYDQLSLIEKCRDMIIFMISLDLIKMTTIFMKAINFVI
jgi:hypothetical protein